MAQPKEWKAAEYFVYFLLFILHGWGKRSATQPQLIYSVVPQKKDCCKFLRQSF